MGHISEIEGLVAVHLYTIYFIESVTSLSGCYKLRVKFIYPIQGIKTTHVYGGHAA